MIKATVNTQRNKIMTNNNEGVIINSNINNAKFYNVNTKEDLPIKGLGKTFYYVNNESSLYIYYNNNYLKINNDLLDSLKELELISSDNKDSISKLINDLLLLREENENYKKELSYKIETTSGSIEDVRNNFNEYKIAFSNIYKNFQSDVDEAFKSLEEFSLKLNNIDSTVENAINDGQLTQDEVLVLKSLKLKLETDFKDLEKQYNDINSYISNNKSIKDSDGNDIYFTDILYNNLNINFQDIQDMWTSENYSDDIIDTIIFNNKVPSKDTFSSDYGIKELYLMLLFLLGKFDTPRKLTTTEKDIWYNISDALSIDLSELLYNFKLILDLIILFDAEDSLMETVASINANINGLQNLIDGLIVNWNGKGDPGPIYNHDTKKFESTEIIGPANTEEWKITKDEHHINDTYVNLKTGKAYRYCNSENIGFHWCKITDTATEEALSQASKTLQALDGRITTYTSKPTSYKKGDLWITEIAYDQYKKGEILNCLRDNNKFSIEDWSRECIYTDDTRAVQAEANAKTYSDGLIKGVNTSIANINNMFSDGVLLPNEKKNIEYKIYSMFGLPLTEYNSNTLLYKQGSGTNAGLSIVSTANNTSTLRAFVLWIKSCEADCDFVNTIKLLDAYFPSDDPYEGSGIYGSTFNVDLQVVELRNQLNNFLTIFLPDSSYGCYFNKIIANLELFNGKPTTLTDPTEFLSWCEIFEKSLNIIKFTFLEYRLNKAELMLSAL